MVDVQRLDMANTLKDCLGSFKETDEALRLSFLVFQVDHVDEELSVDLRLVEVGDLGVDVLIELVTLQHLHVEVTLDVGREISS